MKVKFENVGIIKDANIEIGSLTVITGVNDTGKSTVGKMLFSVIKAFSRYEEDLEVGEQEKIKEIYNLLSEIYFELRERIARNGEIIEIGKDSFGKKIEGIRLKNPSLNNYDLLLKNLSKIRYEARRSDLSLAKVDEFVSRLTYLNNEFNLPELEVTIDKITKICETEEDKNEMVKRALRKALFSEFYNELSFSGKSKVTCIEGKNELIHFEIDKKGIEKFEFYDDLSFEEATFIESPATLQLYDVLKHANTLFELEDKNYSLYHDRGKVPFHIKDLMSKLEKASYFDEIDTKYRNKNQRILTDFIENTNENKFSINSEFSDFFDSQIYLLVDNVSNIINGKIGYSKKSNDFVYYKNIGGKNHLIKSANTATGIKSFGLLQLLMRTDFLNERHLLIIDEPESNLHPEWQLKYAEILAKLSKYGVPLLITTHSPYIVQALRVFSKKEGITDKTKFYLADKVDNLSEIIDVTDDLNKIFLKLSKPFEELVWD
jgi:energy-coupling factor transporter ATP-binding protein EcfA2